MRRPNYQRLFDRTSGISGQTHRLMISASLLLVLACLHRLGYRISTRTKSAASSAGGITTMPTLKNRQKPIGSRSLRMLASHNKVASDPVMARFGPRSTPIKNESEIRGEAWD